ncbi:MAG: hypothetical protein L0099_15235 [Acidobacteria bacterium]|nr:hypothetical protein [Acidobacteriota bacterium]
MKKLLVAFVLALFFAAPAEPLVQEPAPAQKVIKDPAEHNAYVGAIGQQDPKARISGLEGFLAQYPGTVIKEEALEALMGAYQQAGNPAKVVDAANRVLQTNPDNLRALVLMAYIKRVAGPQQNLPEARQLGERGLKTLTTAARREGESEDDFAKLKTQSAIIFHGAIGLAAYQDKDYPTAQQHLRAAVEGNPNDLGDVYYLALSYLEPQPIDTQGLWFVARAVNLSNNQAEILKYGRSKYRRYHGGEEGWAELLAQTKTTPFPPAGFTVKPAPTPIEQAAQMVQNTPVNKMGFGELVFILEIGGEPATKVWSEIQGKPLLFRGKVIEVNRARTTLKVAATQDAIDANRADVEVAMAGTLTVRQAPPVGKDIALQAEPAEFSPQPFLMKMSNGQLVQVAGPRRR